MYVVPTHDFCSKAVCRAVLSTMQGKNARKIHEALLAMYGLKKNVSLPVRRFSPVSQKWHILKPSYMGISLVRDLQEAINDSKLLRYFGHPDAVLVAFQELALFVHGQWERSPSVNEECARRLAMPRPKNPAEFFAMFNS